MKEYKHLIIALFILAVLSPLGLYLPEVCGAKYAWGEWDPAELEKMLGYTPTNMAKAAEMWKAPLPDYSFSNTENVPLAHKSGDYIISAFVGILVCGAVGILGGKLLIKRKTS